MNKKLKDVVLDGDTYHTEQVETQSKTKLEDDKGNGKEMILRFFEYTANPDIFKDRTPSAQELFNAHKKEMELKLWQDGMVADPLIDPRLLFSKDKTHYKFVIGCRLGKGQILTSIPLTLSQLVK